MRKQTKLIGLGLFLILAGVWTLLSSLGYEWMTMEWLWPFVVVVGGLVSLVNGLTADPRNPGSVWFGLMAALCGAVFLYITMGPAEWADLQWLWPAFPAIAGISWLGAWAVDLRQVSNLVLGIIGIGVGGTGLLYTQGRLDVELGTSLVSYWPLILIALGVGLVVQFLVQRR